MKVPAFGCEYDEGYFDEEATGLLATHVCVAQRPDGVVTIRRHGARTGSAPYDRTIEAHIEAYFKDLGLVKLDAGPLYFDLEKNRLVSADTTVVVGRRSAPGDRLLPVRVTAAMTLVLRLAALLGQEGPVEAVVFPGWPPFERHSEFESSRLLLALRCGRRLDVSRRHGFAQREGDLDELRVALDFTGPHACLWVSSEGICTVEVRGPLELHPQAQAVVERFDWN